MVYSGNYVAGYFDQEGDWKLELINLARSQTQFYELCIDKTNPVIELEEFIYGQDARVIPNHGYPYGGVKVSYRDNFEIANMTYTYVNNRGIVTKGSVDSGFTFWQKESYSIRVEDKAGNVTIKNFVINSFDLLVDPHQGVTVGT